MSYRDDAQREAWDTLVEFASEIAEQLGDNGAASNDLFNDYPDGDRYHHETHVDHEYDLSAAAQILDELSDFEETDSGLWEGLEPRRAISAQAAYTYGNAVLSSWYDLVDDLNDAFGAACDHLAFEDDPEPSDFDHDAPDPRTADDKREAFARAYVPAYLALVEAEDAGLVAGGTARVLAEAARDRGDLAALAALADHLEESRAGEPGVDRHAAALRRAAGVSL